MREPRTDSGVYTYTLEERKRWARLCPWITYIQKAVPCEGWTPRRGGCKNLAHWRYKFAKAKKGAWGSDTIDAGKTLHFCWNHLSSRGTGGSMDEQERFTKWCKKNNYPERLIEERGRVHG